LERRGKKALALHRLGGSGATETFSESALPFHQERRPHLLDEVRKPDLENTPVIVLKGTEKPSSVRFQNCSFARSNNQSVLGSAVLKRTPPSVPRTSKNQVLIASGAMRFISSRIGTS
jgi:hypothetical protein